MLVRIETLSRKNGATYCPRLLSLRLNDRVSCYTTKIVGNKNHKNNDDIYKTHQETCGKVWNCNFDPKCIDPVEK